MSSLTKLRTLFYQAVLPFLLFSGALLIMGCHPPSSEQETEELSSTLEQAKMQSSVTPVAGNVFYIMHDVAELQLKVGDPLRDFMQQRDTLAQALHTQDVTTLNAERIALAEHIQQLQQDLTALELKSQEVHAVRQQLLHTLADVGQTPWLNSTTPITTQDLDALQQQFKQLQTTMLSLAEMALTPPSKDEQGQNS